MGVDWTASKIPVDEDVPIPVDEELPEAEILAWLDQPVPGEPTPPRK